MRASIALHYAGIAVDILEIAFKANLRICCKYRQRARRVLPDGAVIDESLDITRLALQQHDHEEWISGPAMLA